MLPVYHLGCIDALTRASNDSTDKNIRYNLVILCWLEMCEYQKSYS